MAAFGPFHRLESPTQSSDIAKVQTSTCEIWGKAARWGAIPAVRAYGGVLLSELRGVEFTTEVAPSHSSPLHIKWCKGGIGVMARAKDGVEYACIPATVENRQI